jgi:hypothetical protein
MASEKTNVVALQGQQLSAPRSAYEQVVFAREMRHRFRTDIYDVWLERGNEVLTRIANTDPEAFAKLYLASLPKEAVLKVEDNRKSPDEDGKSLKIAALFTQLKTIRESRAALEECISDTELDDSAQYEPQQASRRGGGLKVIQLDRVDKDDKAKQ